MLRNQEILSRDIFLSRLSSLEKDIETHAKDVQDYEAHIISLQIEKAALLASISDREEDMKKIFELKRQLDELSLVVEERDSLKAEIERVNCNGVMVSDRQGSLIGEENTIEELSSSPILSNDEKKKDEESQTFLSNLISRLKDLENELLIKDEQIRFQSIQLEKEKNQFQELEHVRFEPDEKNE